LSGNGQRIAYLGYKAGGDTSAIYLIDKTGTAWGAPYLLPEVQSAGINCADNDLDISDDGNTVAYSNCPTLFGMMRIYVSRWEGGNWQPPVIVSGTGPIDQGAQPSISADGAKIVYQNYSHVFYTERLADGSWSSPLNLTQCYFTDSSHYMYYPRISPDGNAVFFWRYRLSGSTVTGKDLFAIRRIGGSWSRPALISGPSIVPTLDNESRPAVNRTGTRVVFNRQIQAPYSGTRLEMTEFSNGSWTAPAVLTGEYKADFPSLTADGQKTAFYHANYANAGMAAITFFGLPPEFDYDTVTQVISTAGGNIVSINDQTMTDFPSGAFSRDSRVTHTINPWKGLLPPTGIFGYRGAGFDLSAVGAVDGMPILTENPFGISINYALQSGPGIESSLKLYSWQPASCQWLEVPSTLNVDSKMVQTTAADRLGLYALLGDTNHVYLPLVLK
jgi:hypothetical protein